MLTTRLDASRPRAPAARRPAQLQIGPWRLVCLLGSGTWTRVYTCRPADFSPAGPADYALKIVTGRGVHGQIGAALLAREVQIGRLVADPHLVPVLSAQLDAPPHYLVMPRLEGTTLAAALAAHGAMPMPHALWIARQIAQGLLALHARGWRHADVKPSNIVVSPQGHATLIDLGFAQRIDERHCPSADAPLGMTPAYSAPELLTQTQAATAKSDIYSLGITLFQMLTGRLPFLETDPTNLAVAHLRQVPPNPRTIVPHLIPRIGWLLHRLLAKEPLRRPDTTELISLLAEIEIEAFAEREV